MANSHLIAVEAIVNKIFSVRSQKIRLDKDLPALYGLVTKFFRPGSNILHLSGGFYSIQI